MQHHCPVCAKQFEELHIVHTSNLEPFTAVPYDWMGGLMAYSMYGVQKQILCQTKTHLHLLFQGGEERLVEMRIFDEERYIVARNPEHPEPCEVQGCEEREGIPCFLQQDMYAPHAWYCAEHAPKEGFCAWCGHFAAGTEAFDFGRPRGLCGSCQEVYKSEFS